MISFMHLSMILHLHLLIQKLLYPYQLIQYLWIIAELHPLLEMLV
jgi:hypothetical protein